MITWTGKCKCDICGKFIGYDELNKGLVINYMKTPDLLLS